MWRIESSKDGRSHTLFASSRREAWRLSAWLQCLGYVVSVRRISAKAPERSDGE